MATAEISRGTKFPDLFSALAAPFPDVKQRQGGRGRMLDYITARQAMNRLDEVLGPENWQDDYYMVDDVLFCSITITLPDGTMVRKADAGGYKEMTERNKQGQDVVDEENTDKTGPSDAFKRAAVKFGVARYLYKDGVANFGATTATIPPDRPRPADYPASPAPRRPAPAADNPDAVAKAALAPAPPSPAEGQPYDGRYGKLPRNGKELFGWMFGLEKSHNVKLKNEIGEYGKRNFRDQPGANGGKLLSNAWDARLWTEAQIAEGAMHIVEVLDGYLSEPAENPR